MIEFDLHILHLEPVNLLTINLYYGQTYRERLGDVFEQEIEQQERGICNNLNRKMLMLDRIMVGRNALPE